MASRTSAIITELLAALRVEHASVDLRTTSDTPRVLCPADAILPPSSAPLLVVTGPRVESTYESAIGGYRNAGEHEWTLWLAATTEDPVARGSAAIEGAHDIITAIQNAHANTANTTLISLVGLLVTLDDVIGEDLEEAPGFAIARGRISWVDYPTRGI